MTAVNLAQLADFIPPTTADDVLLLIAAMGVFAAVFLLAAGVREAAIALVRLLRTRNGGAA